MTFPYPKQSPVYQPPVARLYYAKTQQVAYEKRFNPPAPENQNNELIITEDDEPVDNIFSEKQQRILTDSLYNAWKGPGEGRSFLTFANVGLFYAAQTAPLVPDVLVSLDVEMPADVWEKHNRSYFVWEYGKPPEVVIEIVSSAEVFHYLPKNFRRRSSAEVFHYLPKNFRRRSNLKGKETGTKLQDYAKAGVRYYVIFDPKKQLKKGQLRLYELRGGAYVERTSRWLADVELGLTLWKGKYEDKHDVWLRWCDRDGNLISTGTESTEHERLAKEKAQQRADRERLAKEKAQQRAEQERKRSEKLAAQLRVLGIEPDEL